jgi:uncharacterized protein YbbC (DUF1343 family)
MLAVGLEVLLESQARSLQGKRLGLLTNQASVNRHLVHNRLLLQQKFGERLTTLFSPQHGFYSEKQDNMIESDHCIDPLTGLPIYSLYGELRKPSREMLENVDVLLIDLMDVGTRVYTFLYTMAYCLEAAAESGKRVVVLDRPNPLGGMAVEGNLLTRECRSFVGLYSLPMRHGLTFAELALYINGEYAIGADLEVIAMQGWRREMYFRATDFPWVFPSPNMPTPETALVYPGQVIWEGTNISEGRGTTLPFELFGSPFLKHEEVMAFIEKTALPGCFPRPLLFQPTSGKWANRVCSGFQLHITDPGSYRPYRTSLALMQALMLLYPEQFHYKEPPYEYEYSKLPMDLILGSEEVRRQLEKGVPILEIEDLWQRELHEFDRQRREYFLYD